MCPGGSSGGGGDGRGRVGGVPAAAILNAYIDCLVVAAGLSLSPPPPLTTPRASKRRAGGSPFERASGSPARYSSSPYVCG